MAGTHLAVDFDASALDGAIDRLLDFANGGQDLMLRDMGEYLHKVHSLRFGTEQAPDGTPWAPLSPRYKRRKEAARPGLGILQYDNFLKGTLRYQVSQGELLFGSDREYAAIHHFGGTIEIPARSTLAYFQKRRVEKGDFRFSKKGRSTYAEWVTIPAYTVTMPARPWLGVGDTDQQELLAIAARYLGGTISGTSEAPSSAD